MPSSNEYLKTYMQQRRLKRRVVLLEMRGSKCERCGSGEELEFNHLDRSEKLFTLSGKDLDRSWPKILVELAKCELLCSQCHLEYTAEQYATSEIVTWNKDLHGVHQHGTPRMYHEKACRCELCRYAKKLYRAGLISNDQQVTAIPL